MREQPIIIPQVLDRNETPVGDVRALIQESRLDEAHQAVMALLDRRIVAGDEELIGVALLAQFYQTVITSQPPLSHPGAEPLRPSDKLYQCFDAFLELMHRQQGQIAELRAMVAELL
jgi:hypothetical protein